MITHVAIRHEGKLYSLPEPFRHHHVIHMMVQICGFEHVPGHAEQGFMYESPIEKGCYRFIDRTAAYSMAVTSGQITHDNRAPRHLFSEDLW